jgi:hypothetical protein
MSLVLLVACAAPTQALNNPRQQISRRLRFLFCNQLRNPFLALVIHRQESALADSCCGKFFKRFQLENLDKIRFGILIGRIEFPNINSLEITTRCKCALGQTSQGSDVTAPSAGFVT